jgi:hypothetical protein
MRALGSRPWLVAVSGLLLLACATGCVGTKVNDAGPTTTAASDTSTTSPERPGTFPNASDTGVPPGTALTHYTGPTTITHCGAVISSKIVDGGLNIRVGNGTHSPATPCVTIKDSLIKGPVDDRYQGLGYGPVVLTDTEIAAPLAPSTMGLLTESNWFAWRVNAHGGGYAATQCDGYCELHDSWIHDMFFTSPYHYDAFLTNGNYGAPILLDHNSLLCDFPEGQGNPDGGCAADLGLYGDESNISNVTITNNLFVANPDAFGYCIHAGSNPAKPFSHGTNIVVRDNTFQAGSNGKCGGSGPVADWVYNSGDIWSGNKWDNGSPLNQS